MCLRVPGLAAVLRDLAIARTTQVLGALLSNGVGLLRALDISRATAGEQIVLYATAGRVLLGGRGVFTRDDAPIGKA